MWWRCDRRGGAAGREWEVGGGLTLEESLCGQKERYFNITISYCSEGNIAVLALLICSKADGLGVGRM